MLDENGGLYARHFFVSARLKCAISDQITSMYV